MAIEPPVLPRHRAQAQSLAGMSHPCSYCNAEPNQPCTYVNDGIRQGRIKPTVHGARMVLGRETYRAWQEAMRRYHEDEQKAFKEWSDLNIRGRIHFELSPEQEAWIEEQSRASVERYEARKAAGAKPTKASV